MSSRLFLALTVATGLLVGACGDGEDPAARGAADPGPVHVHGLGINPRDKALFIATHTGLFRLAAAQNEAVRVADRYQDTMGFTVIGPDRFLGSGHPDLRENLPPYLGLIESSDAGESWQSISLQGKADFHALEARGPLVYGFGFDWRTREPQFLVSADRGRSWQERDFPEELSSLALHPSNSNRLLAAGHTSAYMSSNGGRTWRQIGTAATLVAWNSPDELIAVSGDGSVSSSADGAAWHEVGKIAGQPAALEAESDGLYAALHDGTIKRSIDGGATWTVRYQP